ncbi:uncharacterized protein B0T15DRAFT_97291 [Chaetomium strumarium]|uniref:Secreted protein n=1 Tax=Chaetomium strumarium TaxID=1170767 RepID=A0AAJ0GXP7_9PEZI|nr:hypothetical protein B0T15DRAFT_97291 [Chaetomium strumarium]
MRNKKRIVQGLPMLVFLSSTATSAETSAPDWRNMIRWITTAGRERHASGTLTEPTPSIRAGQATAQLRARRS